MKLFIFGLGYAAGSAADYQLARGATITATVRSPAKARSLARAEMTVQVFSPDYCDPRIEDDLVNSDGLLVSVPPGEAGDPTLKAFSTIIARARRLRWIGYLSTIGVYGDRNGQWVDESTPVSPTSERSISRVKAEQSWLDLGKRSDKAVHVFRLSGIYGPGRNQLIQLANGTARRIVKPGQVFNRIHVCDIARVLDASLKQPRAGAIYNVTDNEPAPPQEVVTFAASLLGRNPPVEIAIEDANLSPMGRSFYRENKRVSNALLTHELGVELQYPTYREGLTALHLAGEGTSNGR